MGTAQLLNITPNGFDRMMVPARVERRVFEHVLLHVYGIHAPFRTDYSERRARIVARTGTKIRNTHALAQTSLQDILTRIAK